MQDDTGNRQESDGSTDTFTFPHEAVARGDGDGLAELHAEAAMLAPGYAFEYRGYTLEKVDVGGISPPDHTEFAVVAPHGAHVETISVGAFDRVDGPGGLRAFLNRVVAYGPESMSDWLNPEVA